MAENDIEGSQPGATPPASSLPTDEAKQLFNATKDDLFKRQLSNAEAFDKAILTYSSGALALSLGFLKDFVPLDRASAPYLLFSSWAMFAASIVATIVSYQVSQLGINKQVRLAERYYLDQDESALKEKNRAAICTDWLNWTSGGLFSLGVAITTVFVAVNLKEASMASSARSIALDGVPVPGLQKIVQSVAAQKGAPVPGAAAVPTAAPQQQAAPVAPPANAAPKK